MRTGIRIMCFRVVLKYINDEIDHHNLITKLKKMKVKLIITLKIIFKPLQFYFIN